MMSVSVTQTKLTALNAGSNFKASANFYWLLLFSQLANFSLLAKQLSIWMLALIGLCLLWRFTLLNGHLKQPAKWLLNFFALAGCIVLAISGLQLGLLLSMVHLLCFAYALKQLELAKRSDFYQLILIGLFVLSAAMIFNQALYFSSIVFIVLLLNISVLFYFFTPMFSALRAIKGASKLVLQSLPLAVVLFVIFPRIAPFWQVPLANSAKTGLSDKVTPGDIADLTQSTDLAFRVSFDNNKPLFNQLYWRALVLDDYDGNSWQRSLQSINTEQAITTGKWHFTTNSALSLQQIKQAVSYQVIVQPSYQKWLYSLAVPQLVKQAGKTLALVMLPDYSVINTLPLTQTSSYQLTSFLQKPFDLTLSKQVRAQNLKLPKNSNPKLVVQAQQLRQTSTSDKELIYKVLNNIRQQNYRYTLKPPLLVNNSLEQFYFETKAGFCVHYASSFTFLMRAAGIPARMVTGYMGGEYNTNGNYYSIYQYDAHAWSEVWLAGRGWVRVDPTAAVSPERVEKGFSQSLFAEQSMFSGNIFDLQNYRNVLWLNFIRQQFDALDYQWTRWVIGYTPERQLTLLTHWLGNYEPWQLAVLVAFAISLFALWLWLTNRSKIVKAAQPPWLKIYLNALNLLKKKGVEKQNQQSVADFAEQIKHGFPKAGQAFVLLSANFAQLNYCLITEKEQQRQLKAMQKHFSKFKQEL
jgi:protein-glutamine gamma-glutamyltransferase